MAPLFVKSNFGKNSENKFSDSNLSLGCFKSTRRLGILGTHGVEDMK